MSAFALSPTRTDVRADARPSALALTRLELRKTVDTRAGFWLLLTVAGLCLAVAVLSAVLGHDDDHTLTTILSNTVQPAAILLPVVGILLVSSEWSQRTALQTFTLVPRRGRVIAAKLAAGLVLAVATVVLCLLLSLVATAAAGSGAGDRWALSAALGGQHLVYMGTAMVTGVAFGAALLASAPGVVLYFVLPTAWGFVNALVPGLDAVARWLDTGRALGPLTTERLSATQWAHVGTALALWMVLPLAIGLWRVTRAEIKS